MAIARAIASRPDILIFDEPTASLDGDTGRRIIDFVKRATVAQQKSQAEASRTLLEELMALTRAYQVSNQRTERVDVRVLPVLFRFAKPKNYSLFPGQLVDVYIGEK